MDTQAEITDHGFVAFRVRYEMRRKKKGLRELARELDVPSSNLHRRVNGDVAFDVIEIQQVASALGVDVAVFFAPVERAG